MSKITESAKDQPCIRCDTNDGTTMARHYNGLRQHWYGKGRGIKADDIATADFCDACDFIFTEGRNITGDGERAGKSINRSEMFLHYIIMSNISRRKRGVL